MSIPRIPVIHDDDLRHAVSALANAAFMMRGVFAEIAEGKPLQDIIEERGPYLLLSDAVINQWCAYFGIDGSEITGPG